MTAWSSPVSSKWFCATRYAFIRVARFLRPNTVQFLLGGRHKVLLKLKLGFKLGRLCGEPLALGGKLAKLGLGGGLDLSRLHDQAGVLLGDGGLDALGCGHAAGTVFLRAHRGKFGSGLHLLALLDREGCNYTTAGRDDRRGAMEPVPVPIRA